MEIRRLTEGDAQALWDLRLAALRAEPESFGESVEEHLQLSLEVLVTRLGTDGEDAFVLGAICDSALAGMVGFYRDTREKRRHRGRVWGVYTAPEWRGRGIGQQLLEELLRRARKLPGLRRVLLSVSADQPVPRRLYERCGFRFYGREPQALLVDGRLFDEDHMSLSLEAREEFE